MKKYALYKEDGEIECILVATKEKQVKEEGKLFILCEDDVSDETHYVKEGKVTEKEKLDYTMENQNLVIKLYGLPISTKVTVDDEVVVVDSEITEIEFEIKGMLYTLEIDAGVKYIKEIMEVQVG